MPYLVLLLVLAFSACKQESMDLAEKQTRLEQQSQWERYQHKQEKKSAPALPQLGNEGEFTRPIPAWKTKAESLNSLILVWEDLPDKQKLFGHLLVCFIGMIYLWALGHFSDTPPGLFKCLLLSAGLEVLVFSGLPFLPFVVYLLGLIFFAKFRIVSAFFVTLIYWIIRLVLTTAFLPFLAQVLQFMESLADPIKQR